VATSSTMCKGSRPSRSGSWPLYHQNGDIGRKRFNPSRSAASELRR
jgi:hypothetical protein